MGKIRCPCRINFSLNGFLLYTCTVHDEKTGPTRENRQVRTPSRDVYVTEGLPPTGADLEPVANTNVRVDFSSLCQKKCLTGFSLPFHSTGQQSAQCMYEDGQAGRMPQRQ